MAFPLRQATHDDVTHLTDIYLTAFQHEIFARQVFPKHSPSSTAYWDETLHEELDEPHATVLVLTDPSFNPPDRIVGFVKWVAPGASPTVFSEEGYPEDGNPALAMEYYKKLIDGHHRNMGNTPHWYLDIIGVRPEYMGRGAATQLVTWGLEKATESKLPCFVEATGDAEGFYEKFGFHQIDRVGTDTPEGKAEIVFMLREAEGGLESGRYS